MASASVYHCEYIPFQGPKDLYLFPEDNYDFFYSYLSREEIFKMQIYITILTAMGFAFLPVCLNNSFCIFEILHIKQSVMIHLSLDVSFFMDCGLLSFCRFSTFTPRKWSVLSLQMVFFFIFCILYLTNTGDLLLVSLCIHHL